MTEPLFEGLKKAFDAANLRSVIKGGYFNGDPPASAQVPNEGGATIRPYLVVQPVGEVPEVFTNKGQYDDVRFECHVVYDTFEAAGGVMIAAVQDAIKAGFLAGLITVGAATLKMLRPGQVRFEKALNSWRVAQEWHARTGKAV